MRTDRIHSAGQQCTERKQQTDDKDIEGPNKQRTEGIGDTGPLAEFALDLASLKPEMQSDSAGQSETSFELPTLLDEPEPFRWSAQLWRKVQRQL